MMRNNLQRLGEHVTAIIGTGNIGGALARHLVAGGESVTLAAQDESHAEALADELGPLARAASVEEAVADADAVVFALWLDATKELISQHARLLDGKVVIDPSNPIAFDENGQIMRTPAGPQRTIDPGCSRSRSGRPSGYCASPDRSRRPIR